MDPLVYQYLFGGLVFAVGLGFAARQGYVGASGRGAFRLTWLVGGLLGFFGLQAFLQYAPMTEALAVPFVGQWEEKPVLGTPLDYAVMVAYFVGILFVGTWYAGGKTTTTKDFFFGGQRFAWWLIAFSLLASLIGSYSFVKYAKVGFQHGLASTQTYLNDWFWLPLLIFGWLPLLYYSRITSVPEYFQLRFGRSARNVVTVLLLVYLVGSIGINLFTMGKALEALLGWDVFWSAVLVAVISGIYVTAGGQTSVIMTDLFQGLMLVATGLAILVLGVVELGGPLAFWEHLPRVHRQAFGPFASDPSYPAVGIFWQDGIANSAMFYFLNQGILMRFMAARSVEEGRKATVATLVVLMPLAAVVVASGGWVGRAFVHAGLLPETVDSGRVFFVVAELLAAPGMFGLVLAALTAALMSTVDTLVTAIAAVVVNDVVRPLRPAADDAELMRWARGSSVAVTGVGVALVTVFARFDSIYEAHGAFTAAITPPLVVGLLLGVFWRRATTAGVLATLVGGTLLVAGSMIWPAWIAPLSHGVPMGSPGDGLFGGVNQQPYLRALFGLLVSAVLGVGVSLATRPRPLDEIRGFVWGTVPDAIRRYKGSDGVEGESAFVPAALEAVAEDRVAGVQALPVADLSAPLAAAIGAREGDLLFVSDARPWLGGLRATHAVVGRVVERPDAWLTLGPTAHAVVRPSGAHPVVVQRLC